MTNILKVIVGSQAHGLATSESDYDYRGVFVMPTEKILSIGGITTETRWMEGENDDTQWELGKFLTMATKSNPTVLECFLAPTVSLGGGASERDARFGAELRELFPYVWNSVDVMNAFIGYGHNQRKKFFDLKDVRPHKYAVAYLRTLYQGWELLTTGTFTVKISDTAIGPTLKKWKQKDYLPGEVIQFCLTWEENVRDAFEKNTRKETDLRPINDFILKVRKEYWND